MYRIQRNAVTVKGREMRRRVDREMHGGLVQATNGLARQPSAAWYDMRRKRERWWGNLCHRIDELHANDVPKEKAMLIPAILAAYVEELYSDHPNQAA